MSRAKSAAKLRVAHGMAAIFHHHGLAGRSAACKAAPRTASWPWRAPWRGRRPRPRPRAFWRWLVPWPLPGMIWSCSLGAYSGAEGRRYKRKPDCSERSPLDYTSPQRRPVRLILSFGPSSGRQNRCSPKRRRDRHQEVGDRADRSRNRRCRAKAALHGSRPPSGTRWAGSRKASHRIGDQAGGGDRLSARAVVLFRRQGPVDLGGADREPVVRVVGRVHEHRDRRLCNHIQPGRRATS